MDTIRVAEARREAAVGREVRLQGWVRTRRGSKGGFSFLEINDGSCWKNLQVVVDNTIPDYTNLTMVTTGAAVEVQGALIASPGKGQLWEVRATHVTLLGAADPHTYPLQKKGHSDEFLREHELLLIVRRHNAILLTVQGAIGFATAAAREEAAGDSRCTRLRCRATYPLWS